MNPLILIRGGGDLATGVALRLHHTGFQIAIIELDRPLAVRRTVAFSEAVYDGEKTVEGVMARIVAPDQFQSTLDLGEIPVMVDPNANILRNQIVTSPRRTILIDARLTKTPPELLDVQVPLHIGLGPGFTAGENCHAVIETRRSHTLGRVYWTGPTQIDSGQPEGDARRVLRAPSDGVLTALAEIGEHVEEDQPVAQVQSSSEHGGQTSEIRSPFAGTLRGIIRPGIEVTAGLKVGDVDSRNDSSVCYLVSDKALAIGGGVLEAIFTRYPMGNFEDELGGLE